MLPQFKIFNLKHFHRIIFQTKIIPVIITLLPFIFWLIFRIAYYYFMPLEFDFEFQSDMRCMFVGIYFQKGFSSSSFSRPSLLLLYIAIHLRHCDQKYFLI